MQLSDVPSILHIRDEHGDLTKDLSLGERFEMLAARVLHARVARYRQVGFDLYDSPLYPGIKFQVKIAHAREGQSGPKIINGRDVLMRVAPSWTWSEKASGEVHLYILFGIKQGIIYPFVAPLDIWLAESFESSGGRTLRICSEEYSRCGRYESSIKRNKFWEYSIRNWPLGLFERIGYYTENGIAEQLKLEA